MNVEQIQQLLKDENFYKGEVDGDVGPKTRAAVTAVFNKYKTSYLNKGAGWNDNRKMVAAGQAMLAKQGYYKGQIDGLAGPLTAQAVNKWDIKREPPTPSTVPAYVPSAKDGVADYSNFDAASAKRLKGAHPLLQRLLIAARAKIKFTIMDSQRGEKAQNAAYKKGNSKAQFPNSAHNWNPAVAVDLAPVPLDWNKTDGFIALWRVIGWYNPKNGQGAGLAKDMKIPIRWGGDWNMNGKYTDDGWDFPHYELHPWRDWTKGSKPYKG